MAEYFDLGQGKCIERMEPDKNLSDMKYQNTELWKKLSHLQRKYSELEQLAYGKGQISEEQLVNDMKRKYEKELFDCHSYIQRLEGRLRATATNESLVMEFQEKISQESAEKIIEQDILLRERMIEVEEKDSQILKLENQLALYKNQLLEKESQQRLSQELLLECRGRLKSSEEALDASSMQLALTIQELFLVKSTYENSTLKIDELSSYLEELSEKNNISHKEIDMKLGEKIMKYATLQITCDELNETNLELKRLLTVKDDRMKAMEQMLYSSEGGEGRSGCPLESQASHTPKTTKAPTRLGSHHSPHTPASTSTQIVHYGAFEFPQIPSPTTPTSTIHVPNNNIPTNPVSAFISRDVYDHGIVDEKSELNDLSSSTSDSASTMTVSCDTSPSHISIRREKKREKRDMIRRANANRDTVSAHDTSYYSLSMSSSSSHFNHHSQNIINDLTMKVLSSEKMQESLAKELIKLRTQMFEVSKDESQKNYLSSLMATYSMQQNETFQIISTKFEALSKRLNHMEENLCSHFECYEIKTIKSAKKSSYLINQLEIALTDCQTSLKDLENKSVTMTSEKLKYQKKLKERDDQLRNLIRILKSNEEELEATRRRSSKFIMELREMRSLLGNAGLDFQTSSGFPQFPEQRTQRERETALLDVTCTTVITTGSTDSEEKAEELCKRERKKERGRGRGRVRSDVTSDEGTLSSIDEDEE